jgi:deoxyribonuclease-4
MVKVGVHVSIAGSLDRAVDRAEERGCDAFQIFSRNPRGWNFAPLPDETATKFREKLAATGLISVDHMPYLSNLASPNPDTYKRSVATLTSELDRCQQLGIRYLVTHLGHHLGDGIAGGRKRVIEAINEAFDASDNSVMLILENTAGEKNSVGSSFEHIRGITDGIDAPKRIGVCLDTCHAFAAGYEMRTEDGIAETLRQFDELIGLERLNVVHLNDTKGDRGSGLDRHEHIGMGLIGEDGFWRILHHPVFREVPLICETPIDERRDDLGNIAKVRELAG